MNSEPASQLRTSSGAARPSQMIQGMRLTRSGAVGWVSGPPAPNPSIRRPDIRHCAARGARLTWGGRAARVNVATHARLLECALRQGVHGVVGADRADTTCLALALHPIESGPGAVALANDRGGVPRGVFADKCRPPLRTPGRVTHKQHRRRSAQLPRDRRLHGSGGR